MRSLRWLTVAGVVLLAQGVLAAAASACLIQSFGASGGSPGADGTIRPGGTVSYSIHVVTSPESSDDSRYRIDVGGVVVASGIATPNENGGEWSIKSTFQMPPLGAGKRAVTPQLTLIDSGGFQPAPVALQYNGDPPAPAPTPAQPVPTHEPVAPQPTHTSPKSHQPRSVPAPNQSSRDGTVRPHHESSVQSTTGPRAVPQDAAVTAHRAVPQDVAATAHRAQVVAAAVHTKAKTRHASRTRVRHRIAHQAIRRPSPDVVKTAPAPALPAAVRAVDDHGPSGVGLAILLAMLVGGGGLAVGVRRRGNSRVPVSPPSTVEIDMRAAEIEAELQELLAEARLEAELGERGAGAPS